LYKQSTKGIAQKEIVRSIGKNIYATGYCISPDALIPSDHPELGPVWEWTYENREDLYPRLGSPYKKETIGSVRAIPSKTITELQMIFELTNGTDFLNTIMEGESWQ
jgi:heterodisulfide reductase subunit C